MNSDNNVFGYNLSDSADKKSLIKWSFLIFAFSFIPAMIPELSHHSFVYIITHLDNPDKEFKTSIFFYWIGYSVGLTVLFLYFFANYYQKNYSNRIMNLSPLSTALLMPFYIFVYFFAFYLIFDVVYHIVVYLLEWIFDFELSKRFSDYVHFISMPFLWAFSVWFRYSTKEDNNYNNRLQYDVQNKLRENIFISNFEQPPEGYKYDFINMIEAHTTNNRSLGDAILLLKAHRIGANAILKYNVRESTHTSGYVTSSLGGSISTSHKYNISGTAVRMYKV